MDMSPNEQARWHSHMQTPVLYNHHAPIEVDSQSIERVDLNIITSTPRAAVNEERVLILTPLKDAAPYLNKYFDLLSELTYPHHLIDLAFLVSDSSDDTLAVLSSELDRVQKRTDKIPFHSALIVEKDFGAVGGVANVAERHAFAAQGPRRKAIARARNYLLYTALKPEHSWVYWRDVDIQDSPSKILEDFMDHNKDILVPSMSSSSCNLYDCIWLNKQQIFGFIDMRTAATLRANVIIPDRDFRNFVGSAYRIPVDYNSWQESERGLKLASTLSKDTVLAEGAKDDVATPLYG